ncbi:MULTISPECIES: TetR/AcrR family transcriptional regulator [unclassified Tessaracoccus]|uniref:TetR/AcrR family transcriptional regulator n=1 Tax=unclassified Tessaracoccus TaxID=2635419 RepID=UPI001603C4BA|nr:MULTISPECIES: TetR/AcrR family transcriptional regulator [unclassified Tessaracoccus]MBB1511348.1 TetR/AcrR family transcriptional regulator [Tessaracoccus sp. MC1627]MBB1514948.1 TetR/AcrR family transcriptional regulator [Tessaracoccus sp. MC1679]
MTIELTRRRSETRRRLVLAAIEEFSRRGIDATSVEHLCAAAGFTRGAFYSNFATKDDVCVEVMRHVAEDQVALYRSSLAALPDEMTTEQIIAGILDVNQAGPEVMRTLMEIDLRAYRDPEFGERVDEMRKDVWPLYVDLVTSAAERAGLEFEVDVEDLLLIFEAIWHHPRTAASDQPGLRNRLITAVARHLTREKA